MRGPTIRPTVAAFPMETGRLRTASKAGAATSRSAQPQHKSSSGSRNRISGAAAQRIAWRRAILRSVEEGSHRREAWRSVSLREAPDNLVVRASATATLPIGASVARVPSRVWDKAALAPKHSAIAVLRAVASQDSVGAASVVVAGADSNRRNLYASFHVNSGAGGRRCSG